MFKLNLLQLLCLHVAFHTTSYQQLVSYIMLRKGTKQCYRNCVQPTKTYLRVRAYYHYLRCLKNLLSWKSFHSIENLKKLQKSFHKVFLLLHFCLFLFSRSHTRFTLSKRQQQETSLPVIQRLKRKKENRLIYSKCKFVLRPLSMVR